MWNNQSDYNAGYGGDQGGGYMNQSANFGSPQMGSQEKRGRQRAQNIIPCTIAQVLATERTQDDKFMIDNIELHQVTLVGLVLSVKEANTRLEFQLDDMTGTPLQIMQFIDNDENTPEEERPVPVRENTYVRVFGHVRSFQDKKNVVAFRVLPLLDMNELTTHLLEVIQAHVALTQAEQGGGGGMGNPGMMSMNQGSYAGGQDSYAGAQAANNGLTPVQNQVSLVIKGCVEDQGVSIQAICDKLRGIPMPAIKEAIEFLSSEGHIYSTIDDEHFKSTDAM